MIRDYLPADEPELRRIHQAKGIDYQFPDLNHPLFFVKKVVEVDGKIQGAAVLRGCAETMLLLDKSHPIEMFQVMRSLQDAVLAEAYAKGLDEIHAAVPEIRFDKRLLQLGWTKDRPGWQLWTRSTR